MFIVCFRINKKIPRGPPSPPAPVMHSPSRKVRVLFDLFCVSEVCVLLPIQLIKVGLTGLEIHLALFLSLDDCEGAAGVEDSSLHLKLEKRKGIIHDKVLSVSVLLLKLNYLNVFANTSLSIQSISFRVTQFLWTSAWQLTGGACRRSTSTRTLPSLLRLSTLLTERCISTLH